MNICLITARINKIPKRVLYNDQYSTQLDVIFPQINKGLSHATATARGEISEQIFELYCLGDYIVIECNLLPLKDSKNRKKLNLNIINVYPACIFINK
uniref:Putative single-stranded DNA binding protein n=1 Tax=Sporolithon durum TaxID=48970 RepID=A0A141SCU9_9FLOR|nr:putative single-stranded DNA binding protein [Sporolithon durum]AMK96117.1 putative single-stranded DNA binding protein [Sporolithon durum]